MGANATTFVPSYTSGEVLTAANLSVTNSGIPVFATTVTRDAAFGGTGEKTLAEGQFAYIEATNTTQYYDGAAWVPVNLLAAFDSAQVLTEQSTTSTSYTDLSTAGPAVTVTTGTSAIVLITAGYANNGGSGPASAMSFAVSGATTIAASDNYRGIVGGANTVAACIAATTKLTTLTPGSNVFTAKYRVTSASTGSFAHRSISVWAI